MKSNRFELAGIVRRAVKRIRAKKFCCDGAKHNKHTIPCVNISASRAIEMIFPAQKWIR